MNVIAALFPQATLYGFYDDDAAGGTNSLCPRIDRTVNDISPFHRIPQSLCFMRLRAGLVGDEVHLYHLFTV